MDSGRHAVGGDTMTDAIDHARQLLGIARRADNAAKDTLTITFERNARPDRRVVIEPREREGPDYWRVEQVREGDVWGKTGCEAIDDIHIDGGVR